jgi:tetratricopeptide (TPR) repeat protein
MTSKIKSAYNALIKDDLDSARQMFATLADSDLRAKWGFFLVNLIDDGKLYESPTYFQVRNFLEIDIDFLISHYKGDYVERIAGYSDFLFRINPETYKFIGRVFFNNGLKPQAMFFLERAKSYFYNDPELHYLFADIYFEQGERKKAAAALEACLKVLPGYYPAEAMLKKLAA